MLTQLEDFARFTGIRMARLHLIAEEHRNFVSGIAGEVRTAMAAAEMTGRLLVWLPWLVLVGGQLLGLGTLSVLLKSPLGLVVLPVAALLGWLAQMQAGRITKKAVLVPDDPGLWFDATSQTLSDGLGISRTVTALRCHAQAPAAVERLLAEGLLTGVGLAGRLRQHAGELRAQSLQAKRQELATLPIRLLTPMALFLLPQFFLLLVVPSIAGTIGALFQ